MRAPSQLACSLACALALLAGAAGCGGKTGTRVLSGDVSLREYVTDANGVVTDSVDYIAESGIVVRTLVDSTITDSTRTKDGRFSLSSDARSLRLVVGTTILTADTLGPFAVDHVRTDLAERLLLGDKGAIHFARNPVVDVAPQIRFLIARPDTIRIAIRSIDGTIERTLIERAFPQGSYSLVWDRKLDNGQDAAPGFYELTLEHLWRHAASTNGTGVRDIPGNTPQDFGPYHAGARTFFRLN